ncbi:SEC14-like protein 2 [Trichonephila inaurata madagascariensis]|uniref:SEC14-like protein 2 n=1 Tax=Trichonephila inaurata madagascariensis TaxID=2747483 RepID=A0A8X6WZB5_9ARAC|nr:SEC14-like protein 2 [Trichonephila inaurata madagascariensis]
MENLTNSQFSALKEFKRNVSDILDPYDTDPVLLKWLRARNYNPKKAEVYFREMYRIKQTYQFDTLFNAYTKPEMAEKYEYTAFLGYAKDGSVVRYSPIGKGDHLGFLMSLSTYDCIVYATSFVWEDLERQRKENARTGKEINEITYIFDMEGFSIQDILHKSVLEMALDMGRMVQDYYPEIWGHIFFINVPSYFDTAYNMFKPILRLSVIQKLQVVSKEHVGEVLLKYIDEDVLPVFLGGKRVDSSGNPRCTEFLRFGGKVPERYYVTNRCLLSPSDAGVTDVWIPARGAFNYSIVVQKPRTRFHVQYQTENGSIHVRLFYRKFTSGSPDLPSSDEYLDERDEKTNVQLISPGLRVQSHMVPLDYNNYLAPWAGVYIFRFSNAQSWFGARRLTFRIRLLDSDL